MKRFVPVGMAEGGAENKDNPFSYKVFLSHKKKDLDSEVIHSISDSNLHSSGLEKAEKKILLSEEGVLSVSSPSKENPFSFKHYLKKSSSAVNGNIQPTKNELCSSPGRSKIQEWSNKQVYINDIVLPDQCTETVGKLPDFIEDHISSSKFKHAKDSDLFPEEFDISVSSVSNEDFTYSISDSVSLQNEETVNVCKTSQHENFELDLPSLQNISSVNEVKEDLLTNLPDFISDGILNAEKDCYKEVPFVEVVSQSPSQNFAITPPANLESVTKIKQLQDENAKLLLQLNEAVSKLDLKTARILQLEQQLELLKKKEAEDTAALETMVHQVEVNLQNTTERAVAAEMNVTKLKEEIKLLQAHAKKLQKENETLRESSVGYYDISSQADCLGAQIRSAATSAEVSLKSLLKGVEHVHLLSSLVSDLGKIQEKT